jgi:hypothetical protein
MIDVPSESKGRAKYFGDKAHRQAVGLKDKEVAMEFCNGLLGTSPSLVSILYPSPSSSSSTVAIVLTRSKLMTRLLSLSFVIFLNR